MIWGAEEFLRIRLLEIQKPNERNDLRPLRYVVKRALRRNEWVEFESESGLEDGMGRMPIDPSIFLLRDPEVSIWALQKEDASNRLPLRSCLPQSVSRGGRRIARRMRH